MDYRKPLRTLKSEWDRASVDNRYLFVQAWAANIGYALAATPGLDLDLSLAQNIETFFEPTAWKLAAQVVLPSMCTRTALAVADKSLETIAYLAHDAQQKGGIVKGYAQRGPAALGRACSAAAQQAALLYQHITHS